MLLGAALAPFAPGLSDTAITGPKDWHHADRGVLTAALAGAPPAERQHVRWRYAIAALADDQPDVALGALETMRLAETDLALAASFQLARARAMVELGRFADAAGSLTAPALARNPEACAWRLRAFEGAGAPALALSEWRCAKPALRARPVRERAPFLLAAARAALGAGRPDLSLDFLRFVGQHAPEARLIRGQALLAQGKALAASALFGELASNADPRLAAAVELGTVRASLAARRLAPAAAAERLTRLTFRWRGDSTERAALLLRFDLATRMRDPGAQLAAAATLLRYRNQGGALAPILATVQATITGLLAPTSRVPLAQAAGLYWDYRDLAPGGAAGDALVWRLADRLQEAQLYARAADLLEHQLAERARDVAQGPVSVRVARLWILAGRADKAIEALKLSADVLFPPALLQARQRMEAVALHQLGRTGEALAVLQSVPGSAALQAELLWKDRDWAAYAALAGPALPAGRRLSEVQQALVLRQAVTLGMLGREPALAQLRRRYADLFAGLPTQRAFDQLTRPAGEMDPAALSDALAALPNASPAGDLADLIELAPPPRRHG